MLNDKELEMVSGGINWFKVAVVTYCVVIIYSGAELLTSPMVVGEI